MDIDVLRILSIGGFREGLRVEIGEEFRLMIGVKCSYCLV